MEPYVPYLIGYLVLLNAIGIIAMRNDKIKAKRRMRRTSENALMFVAFAGGALGSWIGMYAFRHKTKHASFVFGVPLLLAWNVFGVLYLTDLLPAGLFG
ncbi:DUF1294 domain-containing protein [Cohnella sp. GCM10027633]|uniref:DUF1294 domain-containing protein n=1 Tax=unclassified Cohnella TaxID=2636738 RepID=UPI003626A250